MGSFWQAGRRRPQLLRTGVSYAAASLTPEMFAVAQEKWGEEGERAGEESKVEKPPLLFERSNDSFTRPAVEVVRPRPPARVRE